MWLKIWSSSDAFLSSVLFSAAVTSVMCIFELWILFKYWKFSVLNISDDKKVRKKKSFSICSLSAVNFAKKSSFTRVGIFLDVFVLLFLILTHFTILQMLWSVTTALMMHALCFFILCLWSTFFFLTLTFLKAFSVSAVWYLFHLHLALLIFIITFVHLFVQYDFDWELIFSFWIMCTTLYMLSSIFCFVKRVFVSWRLCCRICIMVFWFIFFHTLIFLDVACFTSRSKIVQIK